MACFPVAQISEAVLGAVAALSVIWCAAAVPGSAPTSVAIAAELSLPCNQEATEIAKQDLKSGMSAIDFLRAEARGDEAPVIKRLVIELIAKGYRAVPDWVKLSIITKKIILQKGYRDQDVGPIAEEAALASGMQGQK